ncbi:MAG: MBOAT family protein, partial [Selenomonas sp.]|nr:MBOAT family protein [Selenomonas sp.]
MVFSSNIFLFMFLPMVLILYYNPFCRGRKFRNVLLLLASLFFYAWGEPLFVWLMIISIIAGWQAGL